MACHTGLLQILQLGKPRSVMLILQMIQMMQRNLCFLLTTIPRPTSLHWKVKVISWRHIKKRLRQVHLSHLLSYNQILFIPKARRKCLQTQRRKIQLNFPFPRIMLNRDNLQMSLSRRWSRKRTNWTNLSNLLLFQRISHLIIINQLSQTEAQKLQLNLQRIWRGYLLQANPNQRKTISRWKTNFLFCKLTTSP